MSLEIEHIEYKHDDVLLEGVFVTPKDNPNGNTVLVSHPWAGRGEFMLNKAKALAELGYNAFALDMYGKGIFGNSAEECSALMTPIIENRELLQARQLAALDTVKSLPGVKPDKIAAIGFCFGGLCVLDLARIETDICGVVSFHGLLTSADNTKGNTIKSKVLVLHGYDDPMATPDQLTEFAKEMTEKKADWQIVAYGNTVHAFTNPQATDADTADTFLYSKQATDRSWLAMQNFFDEVFI